MEPWTSDCGRLESKVPARPGTRISFGNNEAGVRLQRSPVGASQAMPVSTMSSSRSMSRSTSVDVRKAGSHWCEKLDSRPECPNA